MIPLHIIGISSTLVLYKERHDTWMDALGLQWGNTYRLRSASSFVLPSEQNGELFLQPKIPSMIHWTLIGAAGSRVMRVSIFHDVVLSELHWKRPRYCVRSLLNYPQLVIALYCSVAICMWQRYNDTSVLCSRPACDIFGLMRHSV